VLVPLIGWYFPRAIPALVRGLMRAVISVRLPANAVRSPWWNPSPISDPAVRFRLGDGEVLRSRRGKGFCAAFAIVVSNETAFGSHPYCVVSATYVSTHCFQGK